MRTIETKYEFLTVMGEDKDEKTFRDLGSGFVVV